MKIKKININGYGQFRDLMSPQFSDRLNVIYGSNEAGKSTLMSFVACVLYGLQSHECPPLQGGVHGGKIYIQDSYSRYYTLERLANPRKKSGEFLCIDEQGEDANALWDMNFANIDKELFKAIFWLSYEELTKLPLEQGRLADYLYSASLGAHGVNYVETINTLDNKRQGLFRRKGKKQPIIQQISTLSNLDNQYNQVKLELDCYSQISESKQIIETEIQGLTTAVGKLQNQLLFSKKLERAWAHWERYINTREQLESLCSVEQQRLWQEAQADIELILDNIPRQRQLREKVKELEIDEQQLSAKIRAEIDKLGLAWDEHRIADFVIDLSLKEQLRTIDNKLSKQEQEENHKRGIVNELEEQKFLHKSSQKPWSQLIQPSLLTIVVLGAMTGVLLGGDAGSFIDDLVTLLLFIGSGTAVLFAWGYAYNQWRAVLKDRELRIKQAKYQHRLADERNQHAIGEWKQWLMERNLPLEANPSQINTMIVVIENIQYQINTKNNMKVKLTDYRQELESKCLQMKNIMEKLNLLPDKDHLIQDDLQIESYFERLNERISVKLNLLEQLEQSIRLLAQPEHQMEEIVQGLQKTNILQIQAQIELTTKEIADVNSTLSTQREQLGKLQLQLEQLATDNRLVELNLQRTKEHEALFANVKEWTIATMAKWVLEKSKQTFEAEHQPEVMRLASEFFKAFTEQAYQQVALPIGEKKIRVRNKKGDWLQAEQLSQGTKEQLYLALRLGFMQQFNNRQIGWPIFMDDLVVNFDRERMLSTMRTISGLSAQHQIFFFTCHEHVIEAFEEIAPDGLATFELREQNIESYRKGINNGTRAD
ncbi:ATP-binding protein [Desulfuribacillus alkaliarsenatis]|uniref:YhaN AAA domain-containing protein n=1 Tax=Desulfuribacillus alkaliarsenatis TaxID=766136 RepID=A0A1E5G1E3_9FIRM|nr:AAA family ATPase [Desulfuribacillus alkaliarsenatis]OEF96727.1 hypothetical protein BHF68_06540 [Desulfuribacillus alkaliarsenatis]